MIIAGGLLVGSVAVVATLVTRRTRPVVARVTAPSVLGSDSATQPTGAGSQLPGAAVPVRAGDNARPRDLPNPPRRPVVAATPLTSSARLAERPSSVGRPAQVAQPLDPKKTDALAAPTLPAPQPIPAAAEVRVVLDPTGTRAVDSLFRQGYAQQLRGNLERAKELYERAISQPQPQADAFNNLGVLLLQNGDRFGAAEMFKQAIAHDDRNVNAWVNLGDSFSALGHHAEAMAAFARASQLDATSAAVKVRLAAEYQSIGDTSSARRDFGVALQLAPNDPNVHYNFGKFLQTQGDIAGAIHEYQRFVDLAPGKFSPENIDLIKKHIVLLGRSSQ
jgi:Tfp pilus assembly protein PilF